MKVVPLDDTDAFLSPASIWATAIKHAQARPDFRADPSILRERLLQNGYIEMPVNESTHLLSQHSRPFTKIPSTGF
ncbi:hypothetical protein WGT02_29180 (plasmid) [Rhizobium sp. T1470]|uniref:hypothetical protein n=1 Tax=unclassified Rhizobium TaxID=2613769 RepID=UPI001CD4A6A9|nr:hypothetical protein [Rhizobium sp. T1473]MCA0805018.1 hypothetical protein [Rhizobium sp. T1473]